MRRIKRLQNLLALLWLCATSSMGIGASFDCGNAGTPMEKAICATPQIGRLDSTLGQLSEQLLGELAPTAKGELKAGQLAWIAGRNARCDAAASGPASAFVDCVEPLYQRRINHLRAELGQPHQAHYPHGTGNKICGVCEYSGPDAAMGCAGFTTRSGCVSAKHCAWVVRQCRQ
jgi:uncharacterized protein YecT (DUF1311 family)